MEYNEAMHHSYLTSIKYVQKQESSKTVIYILEYAVKTNSVFSVLWLKI